MPCSLVVLRSKTETLRLSSETRNDIGIFFATVATVPPDQPRDYRHIHADDVLTSTVDLEHVLHQLHCPSNHRAGINRKGDVFPKTEAVLRRLTSVSRFEQIVGCSSRSFCAKSRRFFSNSSFFKTPLTPPEPPPEMGNWFSKIGRD